MQKGQSSTIFLFISIKSEKVIMPVISSNAMTATLVMAAIKKYFPAHDSVVLNNFVFNLSKAAFPD
jgi:hypothetical protein